MEKKQEEINKVKMKQQMPKPNPQGKNKDLFTINAYSLLVSYFLISGLSVFLINNNWKTEHL